MGSPKHLDQMTHDIDVFEHVFAGVRLQGPTESPSTPRVVDLDVRPWIGGEVMSTVQVEVVDLVPDERDTRNLQGPKT